MWKRIRLELARTPAAPEGRADCGYDLLVPIDREGHLQPEQWRKERERAVVRRFWHNEDEQTGTLIHSRHGWAISYRPGEDDDEPIYKLDGHRLRQGEYVTITEHGVPMPFYVATVQAL